MRLRRPITPPPSSAVSLEGVVDLEVRPESGSRLGSPGSWSAGTSYDLQATEWGLIISSSSWLDRSVPDLVPWTEVSSVTAEAVVELPDGGHGQVLEVEVIDGGWLGGSPVRRFATPAPELRAFLAMTSTHLPSTTAEESDQPQGSAVAEAGAIAGLVALTRRLLSWRPGRPEAQHGVGHRRVGPIVVAVLALVLLAGSSTTFSSASGASSHGSADSIADIGNRLQASEKHPSVKLPAATSVPNPAPPSLAASAPLQSHEIFAYAPYWTLPQSSGFDVQDLTTLAYFSVDVNADGSLDESGSGWNGYESQDLVNLVNRSHAAGDRVVLTVTDFSQSSLNAITSDPTAPGRLSSALIAAISAKNLDGVNFDFEGEGSADQSGLTSLITKVSAALKAANPHWQVTMATYASSAGDSDGFYNIAALAPAVDAFFVMAYDMNQQDVPSATAPLVGGGFNDTEAVQQFTSVVSPSKVILGVPYYGYDWPTTDGTITAQATGGENPLSDAVIAASGNPTYWDSSTMTAWTSYQVGSQWHETYFDDPTSLALKAQLANSYKIAGLGIWALGMDGNNPAMLAALLGNAPAAKNYQAGPTTTSTSSTSTTVSGLPGSGFTTTGTWNGHKVSLTPVKAPSLPATRQKLGTLSTFTTDDPVLSCLETGSHLTVWSYASMPHVDVVVATQPQDCAAAAWTIPATTSAATTKTSGSPTSTSTTPTPTTSTTSTTSTTVPSSTTTTTSSSTTTTTTSTTVPSSTTTTTTSTTDPGA